jgi:hypothetical protein
MAKKEKTPEPSRDEIDEGNKDKAKTQDEPSIVSVRWDETDMVAGVVRYILTRTGENGEYSIMGIFDKENKITKEISLSTVLRNQIETQGVKKGDTVLIQYLGMRESQTGRKYRDFALSSIKQATLTEMQSLGAK